MIKEFKELVNAINSPDNEYRENDLDMLNYNMAAFGEYVQIVLKMSSKNYNFYCIYFSTIFAEVK